MIFCPFPSQLTLHTTAQGTRLFRQPISEVASLHRGEDSWTNRLLAAGQVLPLEPSGRLFHLLANIELQPGARLIVDVRGVPVAIADHAFDCGPRHGSIPDAVRTVEILIDRTSIETFLNQGQLS